VAREELRHECDSDPAFYDRWLRFERAFNVISLSDRHESAYREARQLQSPDAPIVEKAARNELAAMVHTAVDRLQSRDCKFIRLKFGLDGPPKTLEEIGQIAGLTRERVRQILKRGLVRLRAQIVELMPSLDDFQPEEEVKLSELADVP
jgi:RNA polymerase sigma factor (sigma-70 family)